MSALEPETEEERIAAGQRQAIERAQKVEELIGQAKETWKRPTAVELATLAAVMAGEKMPAKKFPEVADRALLMWAASAEALRKAISKEVEELEALGKQADVAEKNWPKWLSKLMEGDFPILLDEALKEMLGRGYSRGQRRKIYHDFCYHALRSSGRKEEEIEHAINQELTKRTASGFDATNFAGTAVALDKWRAEQRTKQNQIKARKRWPGAKK